MLYAFTMVREHKRCVTGNVALVRTTARQSNPMAESVFHKGGKHITLFDGYVFLVTVSPYVGTGIPNRYES